MPTKVTIVKKGIHVNDRDANRRNNIFKRQLRVSIKKRSTDLGEQRSEPVKKRSSIVVKVDEVLPPDPTVNKNGEKTGIHNRENPPSSEQMKKVRSMRKFFGPKMPQLACNNCSYAQSCPQFRAGYECAFLPFLNAHDSIESVDDLRNALKQLCAANLRRQHQAMIFETISGATPSVELTEALKMTYEMVADLDDRERETGEASLTVESDDSSIIGRIFGGIANLLGSTETALDTPIQEGRPALPETAAIAAHSVSREVMLDHAKSELARSGNPEHTAPVIEVSDVTVQR